MQENHEKTDRKKAEYRLQMKAIFKDPVYLTLLVFYSMKTSLVCAFAYNLSGVLSSFGYSEVNLAPLMVFRELIIGKNYR